MNCLFKIALIIFLSLPIGSWRQAELQAFNSAGTIYYVATNGNDQNPGSLQYPWRSLYKASITINAGDTVYIRGGTYRESNIFYTDGTSTAPIILAGYPGEAVIIDGNSYTIPPKEFGQALIQVYGDWYIVRDLTVTGSGDQGITAHGIHDTIRSRIFSP